MSNNRTIEEYKKYFNGRLVYNDKGNYQLISPTAKTDISIILNKTYCYYSNYIDIKIIKNCKLLYNEQGRLLKKLDIYGMNSYHVNGLDLESVLFNLVGEDIDIEIFSKALEEIIGLGDIILYGTKWK